MPMRSSVALTQRRLLKSGLQRHSADFPTSFALGAKLGAQALCESGSRCATHWRYGDTTASSQSTGTITS
jgi:hypothetical protein